MNAKQKKFVNALIADLQEKHEQLTSLIETIQEAYDNKSEKWQESEKGEAAQEEINTLEQVASDIETAKDSLGCIDGLAD